MFIKILLKFLIFVIISHNVNGKIIETKYGKINGETQTFNGKQMSMYLGLPYAEPPLGQLRFKKPIPLKQQWKETRDATQWPIPCAQMLFDIPGMNLTQKMSEDCLYLNVFVPLSDTNNTKSVMVWFHGGALMMGSATGTMSPHYLSIGGDVIVVTVHYRLNTFGFLYSGTDDAPGNVGLWDQVLALKWVKENIKDFGGDSEKITIFGVSAGGLSVLLHTLSPASRHLYHNAISMSGTGYGDIVSCEPETCKRLWAKAAQTIGCGENNTEVTTLTPEAIKCLQNADVEKVISIAYTIEKSPNFVKVVVHDSEFLPKKPNIMIKEGNYKKNLNLIIGFTNDEGSFLLPFGDKSERYGPIPKNITRDEAIIELKKYTKIIKNKIPINGDDVAQLYFTGIPEDHNLLPRTIGTALGDYTIACQSLLFAKALYAGDHQSNIYQYYFTREWPSPYKWMGANHGADTISIGGFPFLIPHSYTGDDRHHSENMMNMFGHFAKHGNPSPQFGIDWPKYYTINGHTIAPYYVYSHNETAVNSFRQGLKHLECEFLWKKYIDN